MTNKLVEELPPNWLDIDQEKVETLYMVAEGTVMLALDFIYDYLGLHCNAHCC